MGFVTPPEMAPSQATLTLTNAQINSVPFRLGVIEQRGIRDVIDAHVTPHGAWQGARVGTLVRLWLCPMLAERDPCLVAVRDWVAARSQPCNTWLALTLRDPDCPDDRRGNVLSMVGDETTQAPLDGAMRGQWGRVSRLPPATIRLDSPSVRV